MYPSIYSYFLNVEYEEIVKKGIHFEKEYMNTSNFNFLAVVSFSIKSKGKKINK